MNRYELIYIIDTGLEETARKELIEKFSDIIRQNGGEVEKVDETWGKRRLAYPINDMLEGHYVLVTFLGGGDLPREIERNLEINESVLRYLIIKQVEKKQSVKPRPARVATPAVPPPDVQSPAEPAEEASQAAVAAAPAESTAAETPAVEGAPAVEISPMTEALAPVEEAPVPTEETPAPVEEAPAPAEEASAPAEEAPAPAAEVSAPAEEVSAPVEEVSAADIPAEPAAEEAAEQAPVVQELSDTPTE